MSSNVFFRNKIFSIHYKKMLLFITMVKIVTLDYCDRPDIIETLKSRWLGLCGDMRRSSIAIRVAIIRLYTRENI